MNNQAILSVLDNLCEQGRDSLHATLDLIEQHRGIAIDARLTRCLEVSRNSADRLLRSIDDARDLLAGVFPQGRDMRRFDAARCIGQTVELLNLVAAPDAARILLNKPSEPHMIWQDQQTLERGLTRILEVALKLSVAGGIYAEIARGSAADGIRIAI